MAEPGGCAVGIASRLALVTGHPAGERFRGGEPFQRSLVAIVWVPLLVAGFASDNAPLALVVVVSLIGLVIWVTSVRVVITGGVWIDGDVVVIKNAWSHARMRLAECEIDRGSGTPSSRDRLGFRLRGAEPDRPEIYSSSLGRQLFRRGRVEDFIEMASAGGVTLGKERRLGEEVLGGSWDDIADDS